MASFSRSQFIPKSVTINPVCKNDPLVTKLKDVNNTMRKIDAYVLLGLKGKRKLLDNQRKQDIDGQRKANKLNLIQQQKANPINFIKDKLPRTGLLDSIRNFILYTFLGAAAPLFLKSLPTMLNFAKLLVPFGKGIGEFASNLLGGVVNAVDFGYKVHDKMRGILKTVTGSKYEKDLDSLEKNLNIFLNSAIVLGLAVASSSISGIGGGRKVGPIPTKKGLPPIGNKLNPIRSAGKNLKPVGKFVGKFGRIFGRIPVIGGLIDFALSMMMGEPIGRAAAKAVGSGIGLGLGALIPVIGQIGVGPIIGSIIGDIIGGALYDTLSAFGKPKKHASGGSVGGKSPSRTPRTIKNIKLRRPGKQTRQRTTPGKNVGGEDAIKKIFPSPKDTKTANSLSLLLKNSAIMKKAGVFGNLMGAGLDMMALGQKIEKSTLSGFENYLGYAIQSAIDDQSAANAKLIGNSMFAMATGGIVPAGRTISQNGASPGAVVAREIVSSFTAMLDSKSSEIFQNIRREMLLKAPGGDKESAPVEPGTGGLQVSSSSPDFWLLVTAALFENNNPQSGYQGSADVAQAIYNRVALPGWPKSIREVILQKGQFQPVSDYGDYGAWCAIKDKESALAFIKRFGHTQESLESVAAAILNTTRQNSARTFVGSRDNFRSVSYENANNHLEDSTEQNRFGHVFGFEAGGLNISKFKAGQLSPAMINQQVVSGQVAQHDSMPNGQNGRLPASDLMNVGNGQKLWKSAAVAYLKMKEDAGRDGVHFVLSEGYRSLETQQRYWKNPPSGPGTAARPGTSVHGWGKAIDISSPGAQSWIQKNGMKYGWIWPMWARSSPYEPWHYEYVGGGATPTTKMPAKEIKKLNKLPLNNSRKIPTKQSPLSRRSSFLGPGKLDETIFPPDFIKEFQKGNPNTSSNSKPLKISSSPQLSNLQRITNIATGVYSDIEKQTQILIQPVIV
jgi:hypothetical protein